MCTKKFIEEQWAQKYDRFLRGRQITYMIYVKSTSPTKMATKTVPTAWTTSIWAMRTTIMTQTTSTRMTRTITTRASCTCEHGTWSAQSPSVLMLCHTHLIGSRCSWVFIPSTCHPWASLLDLAFLPFYFDLSFTVFFHSSVLMHPEAHTDLDNLNTVQHNLRNSAKGRLSQVSPTTWSSTSSATPTVPSPTLHRHRTWT